MNENGGKAQSTETRIPSQRWLNGLSAGSRGHGLFYIYHYEAGEPTGYARSAVYNFFRTTGGDFKTVFIQSDMRL